MIIGKVTGQVETADGSKFLRVSAASGEIIAADLVNAAIGDSVILCVGNAAGRGCMDKPIDAAVTAVVSEKK